MQDFIKGLVNQATGYAIAVAATLLTVGLRLYFDLWVGSQYTFVTVFGAVALTVWAAGVGPALLAVVLGYLCSNYLFVAPRGAITLTGIDTGFGLAGYVFSCAVIILIGERLRRARTQAEIDRDSLNLAVTAGNMVAYELDVETMTSTRSGSIGHYGGGATVSVQEILERIYPEDRDKYRKALATAIETGQDLYCDFRIIRPSDMKLMWLEVHGSVTRNRAGKAARIHGVVLETTDKKLLQKELAEKSERKSQFLSTLSHELRNPLAPIKSSVSLLADSRVSGEAREKALQILQRQVTNVERLIEDLLDVSRIEQGKINLRLEKTDLRLAVESALESCAPHCTPKAQQLSVDKPSQPLYVLADEARMQQVLSNLLINAAKFTPARGSITVRCWPEGGKAFISVKDSGAGIAAEHLTTIFDLFFQARGPDELHHPGLGIGLSVSRALVEMHGGTIEARSEGPGKGSEFLVCLPLLQEASA